MEYEALALPLACNYLDLYVVNDIVIICNIRLQTNVYIEMIKKNFKKLIDH